MCFWLTVWSNILGGIGVGLFFVVMYLFIQWFLQATDLVISYNWGYENKNGIFAAWPQFCIKNQSRTRSYLIANIAYTQQGIPHWFDNNALWGAVLEPGTMNNTLLGNPVKDLKSLDDALKLEVTIRLQTGRSFWMRGQGPGQMGRSRIQKLLFDLRAKLESMLIAME